MATTKRTLAERIDEADHFASRYLADGNEAEERGQHEKAERLYVKCQYWLDVFNKLSGNS